MSLRILIVEDIFVEADHLSMILEKSGYTVTGVAKSVEQAMNAIKKDRPDMVMLDIFLKGHLTGIHLAAVLTRQHIPFIYLSANANPSTLEAAKETNPHGFLVKPFREKDILIALDIAAYRDRQTREHLASQERWLGALLTGIIQETVVGERKLLLLAKGLQQSIPFDLIVIAMDHPGPCGNSSFCFIRSDLDEYKRIDPSVWLEHTSPAGPFPESAREGSVKNGTDFKNACLKDGLLDYLRNDHSIRSAMTVMYKEGANPQSGVLFGSKAAEGFTPAHEDLLRTFSGLLRRILKDIGSHPASPASVHNFSPSVSLTHKTRIPGIIGRSSRLLKVLDLVGQVAPSTSTVLITGETGVGKEGIAAAIHRLSDRKEKPLIKINCAAIPTALCESELFGHERGSFTDATDRRIGKFEMATGGTLFFDEIGEMPLAVQAKLLRALQEKEIERIGGTKPIKIDARIIAATNRDLYEEVARGRFRMDLYYRLHVFPIHLPALRERKEDIPLLAGHFLHKLALASGTRPKSLSDRAMQQLLTYSWPGNIRELQHLLERHVVINPTDLIDKIDLPCRTSPEDPVLSSDEDQSLDLLEKTAMMTALQQCNGKVSGRGGAAELLGINPNTFSSRMRKLGIRMKYIVN